MTYADFLLLFLVFPLGTLVLILRRRLLDKRYLAIVGALTLVSLIYMAPWDHIAAVGGLWTWVNDRTWGLRWWAIPPEEYLFCALEALLAITLTFAVLTRKNTKASINISTSLGTASLDDTSVPTQLNTAPISPWEEGRERSMPTTSSDQQARS
jgi:lycopene cyclase domain-containing protein